MRATVKLLAVIGCACLAAEARENCGHDVSGSPRFEQTTVGDQFALIHYFSPSTIVMDDPKDPRHRLFGECRGQAVVHNGVAVWDGACVYKTQSGDSYWATWSAKPGDTGTENRDTLHGTSLIRASGKFAAFDGKRVKWSGLTNGGSYFCSE